MAAEVSLTMRIGVLATVQAIISGVPSSIARFIHLCPNGGSQHQGPPDAVPRCGVPITLTQHPTLRRRPSRPLEPQAQRTSASGRANRAPPAVSRTLCVQTTAVKGCQRSPYSEPPGSGKLSHPGSPILSQAGSPMLSHPGAGMLSHPVGR
jgi:hypothetical protein